MIWSFQRKILLYCYSTLYSNLSSIKIEYLKPNPTIYLKKLYMYKLRVFIMQMCE